MLTAARFCLVVLLFLPPRPSIVTYRLLRLTFNFVVRKSGKNHASKLHGYLASLDPVFDQPPKPILPLVAHPPIIKKVFSRPRFSRKLATMVASVNIQGAANIVRWTWTIRARKKLTTWNKVLAFPLGEVFFSPLRSFYRIRVLSCVMIFMIFTVQTIENNRLDVAEIRKSKYHLSTPGGRFIRAEAKSCREIAYNKNIVCNGDSFGRIASCFRKCSTRIVIPSSRFTIELFERTFCIFMRWS